MFGLMQRHELLISSIIVHAARHHGDAEVVSRRENGEIVRTTYTAVERRARQLMSLLRDLGVQFGDRVATLAMNSDRHLELYYAITGLGAVCHTINPRLSPDDIAYIADHAEDGVVFVDPVFLPLAAAVAAKIPDRLHAIVVLGEEAELKTCDLPAGVRLHAYETLMAETRQAPDWPIFDENTASGLCYTSGTTGRPKGVLYSHRSTVLYALAVNGADVVGLKSRDRVVPVVPMFHVNAWGLPFMAPMTGAALLMPGRHLDPVSLLDLLNRERATCSVGVPTVWLALLKHLRATDARMETLKRLVIGGAAFPRASIEAFNDLGVEVKHGWGMTASRKYASPGGHAQLFRRQGHQIRDSRKSRDRGRVALRRDRQGTEDGIAQALFDNLTARNLAKRGVPASIALRRFSWPTVCAGPFSKKNLGARYRDLALGRRDRGSRLKGW
jgi:3-(methylthio)propionyl---CoA ligase